MATDLRKLAKPLGKSSAVGAEDKSVADTTGITASESIPGTLGGGIYSIRELRQRAIAAGSRPEIMARPEFLIAECERLGEIEPVRLLDATREATLRLYSALVNGYEFSVTLDGNFRAKADGGRTLEEFEDALAQFKSQADQYFNETFQAAVQAEDDRLIDLIEKQDYTGLDSPYSADEQRIVKFADKQLGVRNCSAEFATIAILQAYGVPLGEKVEEAEGVVTNVMHEYPKRITLALEAMETPL